MALATFHADKMRSLIVHVLASGEPGEICVGDMNLVMYLADLIHLAARGRTISGDSYLRGRFRPVAKHLASVRAKLVAEGRIDEHVLGHGEDARIALSLVRRSGTAWSSMKPLSALEHASLTVALEHVLGVVDRSARLPALYDTRTDNAARLGEPIDLAAAIAA